MYCGTWKRALARSLAPCLSKKGHVNKTKSTSISALFCQDTFTVCLCWSLVGSEYFGASSCLLRQGGHGRCTADCDITGGPSIWSGDGGCRRLYAVSVRVLGYYGLPWYTCLYYQARYLYYPYLQTVIITLADTTYTYTYTSLFGYSARVGNTPSSRPLSRILSKLGKSMDACQELPLVA